MMLAGLMKKESILIDNIPGILLGEKSDRIYLYVHGQGGNKEEAVRFAQIADPKGWQVLGIDLPEHGERKDTAKLYPWEVIPELNKAAEYLAGNWSNVAIRANSIGAWFSMLAFSRKHLEKCLFVSPVLDMERLITDMMKWSLVTEEQLQIKKEIPTDFGQTLSWDYLCYVRQHPVTEWNIPTEILYAGNDNMIQKETVTAFAAKFHCNLTVMENGEHWFHTAEQLQVLNDWEQRMA